MAEMMTVAQKAENLKKWATMAGIGIAGFIVAPFVFISISGIIGAAIAAGLGLVLVSLAPWFALKVANWKYRLIENEKTSHIAKVAEAAAENPIETLQNILQQNHVAFGKFKNSVTQAVTARDTFKQKVAEFKKQFPHRSAEFEQKLAQMTDKIERKKTALAVAADQLEVGKAKLEEMKAYWDMSQAMQDANTAAGLDTDDNFAQLKMDTAVDAVFESMNKAFAQLEVEDHLEEEKQFRQGIENNPADVIIPDVSVKVKPTVKVL